MLQPILASEEKGASEPTSQPLRIRRMVKPTTHRRPPQRFESDDDEEEPPKGPTLESLSVTIKTLRLEIRRLNNRLSESIIKTQNLEDDLHHVRRGLGTKVQRIAKAANVLDALDPFF